MKKYYFISLGIILATIIMSVLVPLLYITLMSNPLSFIFSSVHANNIFYSGSISEELDKNNLEIAQSLTGLSGKELRVLDSIRLTGTFLGLIGIVFLSITIIVHIIKTLLGRNNSI